MDITHLSSLTVAVAVVLVYRQQLWLFFLFSHKSLTSTPKRAHFTSCSACRGFCPYRMQYVTRYLTFVVCAKLSGVVVRRALVVRRLVVRCVYTRGLRRLVGWRMRSGWWLSLNISFISTTSTIRSVNFAPLVRTTVPWIEKMITFWTKLERELDSRIREKIWININRFCRDVEKVLTPREWIHKCRYVDDADASADTV